MKKICTLVHGIIKLHFSPTLTKYLPLSPCILLHYIFHSSPLLMTSFTPNYLLAFRVHFSPFVIKHLKASSPLATKSISSKKKFTSDRVLYQLNPAYLPLFEQAPPFSKLVAPPILHPLWCQLWLVGVVFKRNWTHGDSSTWLAMPPYIIYLFNLWELWLGLLPLSNLSWLIDTNL